MKPDLEIYPDPQALFKAAAEVFARELTNVLEHNPRASFVLTGGPTARELYEYMGTECGGFRDWGSIDFFWGDERCVPPDDEESNYHLARQALLSRFAVPERNIHRIPAESKDPVKAALSYEKVIQTYFRGQSTPSFDLVHLGMGDDGHAASLFPGSHWDENRLVVANFSPRHPFERISMTLRLLNAARRVIFVVSGKAKASALKRIVEEPACDYPAKQVQPASGRLTWMADAEAASLLGSA